MVLIYEKNPEEEFIQQGGKLSKVAKIFLFA
jgi:hypothetical protein